MLKHFTGTHDHKIDDKGRVSLPSEFRRVLDAVGSKDALYIVPQLDDPRAHVVFTTEAYSNLIERHNTREYASFAAQQRMELKLVTRASQIQVDDVGRIVIAKALRAGISPATFDRLFAPDFSRYRCRSPTQCTPCSGCSTTRGCCSR